MRIYRVLGNSGQERVESARRSVASPTAPSEGIGVRTRLNPNRFRSLEGMNRLRCWRSRPLLRPRIDQSFGDALLLIAPDLIHAGRLARGDAVGGDRRRIDLSLFNAFK